MEWAEAMHECLSRDDEQWMTAARRGMKRMSHRLAERCRTRIDKYLRESVLIELLNELLKLT